jgi:predicted transcriptional regulator
MSNFVTTDLLTRMKNKSLTGGTVTPQDIIETIELMNANAIASAKLSDRLSSSITITAQGFRAVDESLDIQGECLESLATVTNSLIESLELIDDDMDVVYNDINDIVDGAGIGSDTLMYCRHSDIDNIVVEAPVVPQSSNICHGTLHSISIVNDDGTINELKFS